MMKIYPINKLYCSRLLFPKFSFIHFSVTVLTRMMMLEEEQISFRSASLMFDGVEDYSHQIAEMIGLRNESNFIQAGVSGYLLFI